MVTLEVVTLSLNAYVFKCITCEYRASWLLCVCLRAVKPHVMHNYKVIFHCSLLLHFFLSPLVIVEYVSAPKGPNNRK
jgi:hypothetical protein